MPKPTVIILEGNYLGLEAARELEAAGYPFRVVGYSSHDLALNSNRVQGHVLPLPQADSQGLLKGLLDIGGAIPGAKVLLGISEGYRKWISENRAALAKEFRLLAYDEQMIAATLDKWNQAQMAVNLGLSIPGTSILNEAGELARELKYPLVIKPRYSPKTQSFRDHFGAKVLIARNREQLTLHCRSIIQSGFSPMIQELVSGFDFNQFLFGAAVKDGIPYAITMMQKLKTDPSPYGSGVIIRTIHHKELLAAGCRFVKSINFTGICDLEFMRDWDTGEFQFIEFNPRYGFGQRVAQLAGAGLVEMAVRLAQGQLPAEPVIAKPGFYWVHFDELVKEKIMPWRNWAFRQLRTKENTCRMFDIRDCRPEMLHAGNIARYFFLRLIGKRGNE